MRSLLITLLLLTLGPAIPAGAQSTWSKLGDPAMPLPAELTGDAVEVVTIKRSRIVTSKKPFAIGDAQVTEFKRGWRKSDESSFTTLEGFGVAREKATWKFTFRIDDRTSGWRGACAAFSDRGEVSIGSFSADTAIDEIVECELVDESAAKSWTLKLDTSIHPRIITAEIVSGGTLSDGTTTFDVVSSYAIDGISLPAMWPTGFLFASDGRWIAGAQSSMKGALHIRRDVDAPDRRAVTTAAAALLLHATMARIESM